MSPMLSRHTRILAVPIVLLAAAACDDTPGPAAPPVDAQPQAALAASGPGGAEPTLALARAGNAGFGRINGVSLSVSPRAAGALAAVAGVAPGTLVRSILQPGTQDGDFSPGFRQVCPSSVNTGLAFDGTNLILSCWESNRLDFLSTADAHVVRQLVVNGMSDIRAMAWDGKSNRLWACNDGNQVYLVDTSDPDGNGQVGPGAEVQYKFNVHSCVDGLAFDGADETIWSSPDASMPINRYSKTGTLLSSYNNYALTGGSYGNSGLAIGAGKVYMANNGGQQIWVADKPPTTSTLFAAFPRRIEDLECDDITFRADGISVIWQQDAYDRRIQAYAIEPNACPFGGFDVPQTVMDVQPGRISLTGNPVVNVILISNALFDATQANLANIRFVVNGNTANAAPVAMRGGAYVTSTRDWNNDGRVDRMVVFNMAALRNAGLAAGATNLVVQDVASATNKFQANDTVLPAIVP